MGNLISDRKNARWFSLKLSRNTDAAIIDHLEQQENIQGYIKRLILEDMSRQTKPQPEPAKAEANFSATLELMKQIMK